MTEEEINQEFKKYVYRVNELERQISILLNGENTLECIPALMECLFTALKIYTTKEREKAERFLKDIKEQYEDREADLKEELKIA